MGTSSVATATKSKLQDHPHAYGDKKIIILCFVKILGSSPRVWGQGGTVT